MRFLISSVLLFITVSISAQVSTVYVSGQSLSDHFRLHPSSDTEVKIYGSPYADEHWTVGTIAFNNVEEVVSDHLRLNAYSNELEIFNKGEKMAIIQPFKVEEVKLGNRKYIYSFYIFQYGKSEYISSSYFQLLNKGKIELLKRYYTTIMNNSYVSNYMGGGGDGKNYYNLKSELYYRIDGDESARELSKKKKDLLKLMSDKEDLVYDFIKRNNIKIKSEDDIQKLIEYYNSI